MALFDSKKEKSKGNPPDEVGPVSDNIGVAIWSNRDGDHDVKIGESMRIRNKPIFVRSTVRLSLLREKALAIRTVAEVFANAKEAGVSDEVREDLADLARRLDAAFETSVAKVAEDDQSGNGLFG